MRPVPLACHLHLLRTMKIATRLVLSVFIFLAANVAAASETNRSGESSVEAELAALVLEALPLGAFQTPEVPNIVCPPGTYLLETPDMVLCIGEYDYREHAPPGTKKTLKACAVFPDFGNQPICILVHIICSDEGICRFRVVMPGVLQLLGLGSFDCVIVPDDQHTPQIIYCELPFR